MTLPEAAPHEPGGTYNAYSIMDRVFLEDLDTGLEVRGENEINTHRNLKAGRPLWMSVRPETAERLEREFVERIEADALADAKMKGFRLESPIRVAEEFREMVRGEFRRIIYTGTMSYSRQLVRPAHETAVAIWLAGLDRG